MLVPSARKLLPSKFNVESCGSPANEEFFSDTRRPRDFSSQKKTDQKCSEIRIFKIKFQQTHGNVEYYN